MRRERRSCSAILIALSAAAWLSARSSLADDLCDAPTLFRWNSSSDEKSDKPEKGKEEEGKSKFDEPLESDRPDFTEASSTVGKGITQIEMGYTFTHDRSDSTETQEHSFPEALFRIGMFADWWEWRIAYNHGAQGVTVGGVPFTSETGAQDLYLGVKIGLTEQSGILPEMALIPQMTVPSGAKPFTAGIVQPGVNWLYGWAISERSAVRICSTRSTLKLLSGSPEMIRS